MSRPRYFGYQTRSAESVLITQGCRRVASVRGEDQVRRFLSEMREGDPQQVLARWTSACEATNTVAVD